MRITDLILFIPMALDGVRVPGTTIPVNEIAAVILVGLALTRAPRGDLRIPPWFMTLGGGVLLTLLLSAQINGVLDTRRLGHVAVVLVLAVVLASGRVDARAAAVGMATGIVAGVAYGIAFIGQSSYPGRMSGIMGDPNAAGMALVVLGCLAVGGLQRRWVQAAMVAVCLAGVWFTVSRTSMLAVAVVAAWLFVGRRLGPVFGSVVLIAVTQLILYFPDEWKIQGRFADREGSDELRERILVQEHIDVARSPWIGNGPGTASVDLDGQTLFFHSSYLSLRAEAGWIGLAFFAALLASVFWYLVTVPDRRRTVWLEASLIGGLICAMNLGEVLLATPMWIALGLAMREAAMDRGSYGAASSGRRIERLLEASPYAGMGSRSLAPAGGLGEPSGPRPPAVRDPAFPGD